MIRVLLVDDEPFITKGLSVLIDWNREGFEIVATKSNGLEAVEFLRNEKVDLIIADIQMPEMTGIELLETIRKEKLSDAHFVFLTGYSDFHYAQAAIRNQCMDYILKPVERERLLELLHRVFKLTDESRKDEENKKLLEHTYLSKHIIALISGKYDEVNLDYIKNNMRLSAGVRYVEIEAIGDQDAEELSEGILKQTQRDVYQALKECLGPNENHALLDVTLTEKRYDIGFVFCNYLAEEASTIWTDEQYLEHLRRKLENMTDKRISMFVGKKVSGIEGLSKSFGTVCILKSLEGFRSRKQLYIYEKEVQVNQNGVVLCKNSLDALLVAIEQNNQGAIAQSVDRLFTEMCDLGCTHDTVNLNINYLLFQLIHLATEQDSEVDQEEILHRISDSSFEEGGMRGSSQHLMKFALEYADYLSQLKKNVSHSVLQDIEREVREHYAENLSLGDLGEKYYINRSYLGQLFRKQYGCSFKDYLTNYRINEAAKMLVRTDEKISQIAEDVGYKDCDYFIRKFIEIKGCTPFKYRKNSNI